MVIKLTKFRTLETSADGGHRYIIGDIDYKGRRRQIVVYFSDKFNEQKLEGKTEITVEGTLIDEDNQSLNLLESRLVY